MKGRNLLSRLFAHSLTTESMMPAPAQAQTRSLAGVQLSWESDPRWGREHWQIRQEPIQWPNNARVAVVCAVTFGFPDMNFKAPPQGAFGYGGPVGYSHIQLYGKRGIWRILDALDRYRIKASCEISGIAAEQFPDIVKETTRRGHEIVARHWALNVFHDEHPVDVDRQLIRKTISTIEKVTGKRSTGWVAPDLRFGEKTLQILAEEGIGWHACSLSDELPYAIQVSGKRMLVLPHAEEHFVDAEHVMHVRAPEIFLEYFNREFGTLYREGAKTPKIFNVSFQAQFGGRPYFIGVVEEVLSNLTRTADVWIATRQQIADWWNERKYS